MSTPVRYDDQYCPIARALDALGDRWTLLVLRELVPGPRRFTDLKRALVGITPAVLSGRLRKLSDQGYVAEIPDDAATRVRYALTERGRATQPVMRALARFGMDLLDDPDGAGDIRPWAAFQSALMVWFDPVAAADLAVDERYLVRIDGEEMMFSSVRGGGTEREPVLTVDAAAATVFAVRQGRRGWDDAVAAGELVVDGPPSAIHRFRRLFRI